MQVATIQSKRLGWKKPRTQQTLVIQKKRSGPIKQYGKGFQPNAPRQAMAPELKHYSTGLDLTALDTAPSSTSPALYHITSLNNLAQGDAEDARTGNKICLKKVNLRIKVSVDPNSDASNANIVADAHEYRVILYLDTSPNGAAPAWGDMFDTNPSNDGQLYDFNKIAGCDRFKILSDQFIRVPPSFVTYDGTNFHSYGNFKFFKCSIPLNCPIWFSDSTSNLTAIQKNNVGIWICSDASNTAYPNMKFSYRSRIRYTDY